MKFLFLPLLILFVTVLYFVIKIGNHHLRILTMRERKFYFDKVISLINSDNNPADTELVINLTVKRDQV